MKYIVIVVILIFSLPVSASVGIEEQILSNNKALQASKNKMEADILNLRSENNLSDPEVEMSYIFTKPERTMELSVTESVDWPGLYSARKKYIGHQITAFQYMYMEEYLGLSLQVRNLLNDLIDTNKRIALTKKILAEEEKLLELYEKNLDNSSFTIIEVNKLKLEIFENKTQFKALVVKKNSIKQDLKALNDGNELQGFGLDETSYEDFKLQGVDSYISDYLDYSPEQKIAEQQKLSGKQGVSVAKLSGLPGFTFGYSYKNEGGEKGHGFVLGMSIPIFSNRHKRNSAKAEFIANSLSEQNAGLMAEANIRSVYNAILSQQEQAEEYASIVENPEYYSILRKSLDCGQITLRDYIIELRDLALATEKLYDMEYDCQNKFAELSKYEVLKDANLFSR